MKRRALLAVYVYAGVAMATGYLGQAQVRDVTPVTDAMLQDPDPADWLSWRRTLDGWGYSPLEQIDRSNVDELRLAWSWGFEPGVSQTTPIVHDGVMYVANPGNVVQALDARTGDFMWEYRHEMDVRSRSAAQMRSLAVYQDLVILNTFDAHTGCPDGRGALGYAGRGRPGRLHLFERTDRRRGDGRRRDDRLRALP